MVLLEPSPLPGKSKAWAVASHIYAVSEKRLKPAYQQGKAVRISFERMGKVLKAMSLRLPLTPPESLKPLPKERP